MLRSERRDEKRTRRVEKIRRKSNRKALQVIIEAAAKRRTKPARIGRRVE
jgi:hypothetical protein